jgi:hypothetical protein
VRVIIYLITFTLFFSSIQSSFRKDQYNFDGRTSK